MDAVQVKKQEKKKKEKIDSTHNAAGLIETGSRNLSIHEKPHFNSGAHVNPRVNNDLFLSLLNGKKRERRTHSVSD